ncbi:unnamed protein product [Didymodactylos carnosus]|uniref:Uncharacterized protein n=1 Tax=Didymodactylos carnosus TaxID=1234261 RepID=A0A815G1K4_9BILA|nr:unnamed protein product [Didymodactylos carnosus]CAF4187685.1 unnamed protein product [Didymodactylos carnosus]
MPSYPQYSASSPQQDQSSLSLSFPQPMTSYPLLSSSPFSSNQRSSSSHPLHVHHHHSYSSDSRQQDSQRSVLLPSINSAGSSITGWHDNSRHESPHRHQSSSSDRYRSRPKLRPHQHLLDRKPENCPPQLTDKQKKKWLNAGQKANANHELIANTPPFSASDVDYGKPIHLHRYTSPDILKSSITAISDIHLFMIDTESESVYRQPSIPALIQIQCIENEHKAVVLIIEIQHLPHHSTIEFKFIHQLCDHIFSKHSTIMTWGNLMNELSPFTSTRLFDLSNVTNPINLQTFFTNFWNQRHPHILQCSHQKQEINASSNRDALELICHVTEMNVEDEYVDDKHADYVSCICPKEYRPYKSNSSSNWSLQKALKFTFNCALDKELTQNAWTCGLDKALHHHLTAEKQVIIENMIKYAVNDVLAPTKLYFYILRKSAEAILTVQSVLGPSQALPSPSSSFPIANGNNTINELPLVINDSSQHQLPTFFVLSDSHGKCLNKQLLSQTTTEMTTTNHHVIITAVSGLKWIDNYEPHLSLVHLIHTPTISSFLSRATALVLLIGTNSIRLTKSTDVIQQVEQLITHIRNNHQQLEDEQNIAIIPSFSCAKTTQKFPTTTSLEQNIESYNNLLISLEQTMKFSILDIRIGQHELANDRIHVHHDAHDKIKAGIFDYFNRFISVPPPPEIQSVIAEPHDQQQDHQKSSKRGLRSKESENKRNQARHQRQYHHLLQHQISRAICPSWSMTLIKTVLDSYNVNYYHTPFPLQGQLHLRFKTQAEADHANNILPITAFDENNLRHWTHNESHS